ncbi:MAG TPA: VOC family protein [Solirubrobacteraceae bacterium]|nr:VOC family protein [Solirubrobacteraceae bacterium]
MSDAPVLLGWVIVYVDDPPAAREFYMRAFGLEGGFAAGSEYAELDTGATKLAFAAYALGETNFAGGVRRASPEGQPANVEIALACEDVDGAHTRALQAGCTSLTEPADKPHGQRVAWIRDPFGTLIELASPL